MGWLKSAFNSIYLFWFVLSVPGLLRTAQYLSGGIYYGEFIHFTGEFSTQLLIITLAVSPLRSMFGGQRWTAWLMERRRYLGVATFGYAVLHLAAYLEKLWGQGKIAGEAMEPGMFTGWIAMAVFAALALTSNDRSVRWLKKRWKSLHRLVYPAAMLTLLHWILVAFDPLVAYVHTGVLILIVALGYCFKRR